VTADPDAQNGFLEFLLPLYGNVRHGSPLSLATSALAVNLTFAWSVRGLDSELASTLHGKALTLTQAAINDPTQNTTDETLMTVLLLGTYDVLSRGSRSQRPSGLHKNGALALVKHRGALNFETEVSRRLLIAVRHQVIRTALQKAEQIPSDPAVWQNSGSMPENPATRLDVFAAELANLKALVESLKIPTPSPPSPLQLSTGARAVSPTSCAETVIKILRSALATALDLDARLAEWPKHIPTFWHPTSVPSPSCIDPSIVAAGLYDTSCDIYPSIYVAGLWNWYRALRVATIKIIVTCQRRLIHVNFQGDLRTTTEHPTETVQTLVDEFCASIPFHLGNRTSPTPPDKLEGVAYPHLPSKDVDGHFRYTTAMSRAEHMRAAACSGGWFLLDPIREIIQITAADAPRYSGFGVETETERTVLLPLREGQREWIFAQVQRIQAIYVIRRSPSPRPATAMVNWARFGSQKYPIRVAETKRWKHPSYANS
jgi:hypothetical protein